MSRESELNSLVLLLHKRERGELFKGCVFARGIRENEKGVDMKKGMFGAQLAFLCGAVVAVSLGGCSKKNESKNFPRQPEIVSFKSNDEAKQAFQSARLLCGKSGECPENVGSLMFLQGEEVDVCTAFLISPKIIMTNSHCLPDGVATESTSGDENSKLVGGVIFKDQKQVVAIKQVLFSSKLGVSPLGPAWEQDYAFLEIAEPLTARKPVEISREGLKDNQIYRVVRVETPDEKSLTREVSEVSCKSVQGSVDSPGFVQDQQPIAVLSRCVLKHGNSGSPIFSEDHKVVALVSAMSRLSGSNAALTMFRQDLGESKGRSEMSLNLATNMSCVNFPKEVSVVARPGLCDAPLGKSDVDKVISVHNQLLAGQQSELEASLAKSLSRSSERSSGGVLWTSHRDAAQDLYIKQGFISRLALEPKCLQAPLSQPRAFELKNVFVRKRLDQDGRLALTHFSTTAVRVLLGATKFDSSVGYSIATIEKSEELPEWIGNDWQTSLWGGSKVLIKMCPSAEKK